MNITKSRFRWLVTTSVVAAVLGGVASLVGESSLPPPLRHYVAEYYESDLTTKDLAIACVAIPLVIAVVYSIVGLYRFWPSARPLTVGAMIAGLALQPFFGPTVDTGLATALYNASTLLTGVIIAIVYLTSAREWFLATDAQCERSAN